MKNDQTLLIGVGAVVAIALAVAAARGALPDLSVFNPLEGWSTRKSCFAFVIALAATLLSGAAIKWSDRDLPPKQPSSATLEWVYSSKTASEVVSDYGAQRSAAIRGVLIDSIAFIPSYVLLIATLSFLVARGWGPNPWAAWTVAAGWSAAFAGALDYLENAGIYAALGGVTTRVAPLTYAACQLKWVIAFAAIDFAVIALLARLAGR